MNRYCIKRRRLSDNDEEHILGERFEGIRYTPYTMMKLKLSWMEDDFIECSDEIESMIKEATYTRNISDSECDMYSDILKSAFASVCVDLDIYMHLNYTYCYKNSKNKFVPLIKNGWDKNTIKEFKIKRKNLKNYIKNTEVKRTPFIIEEKDDKKESENGKVYYGRTQIRDFAADIVRLYYLSSEFRKLFDLKEQSSPKKYYFEEMKRKLQVDKVLIKKHEDIWLCERLLGINTALAFYSFFKVIFKNLTIREIESKYFEIMDKIISIIMKWEGVYSRTIIIHKMKILWEILNRTKRNVCQKDYIEEFLEYIYRQVLCHVMPTQIRKYQVYSYLVTKENDDDYITKIEKWRNYFDEYIEENNGYYFTKRNIQKVENERLYSIIQEIVISKCMK